jgi:lipid-A-disaccharide synthase
VQILISAGEASGEMYGAQLMAALRQHDKSIEFFGAGGERMRAAGCDIVVDAKDLAVVGITEILNHLPKIWGLFNQLITEADARKPDLAIVIDSPAFNWRVAREMHARGVPVVYYVCPQFWAWRQGRVRLLKKYVSKALVIFPFEERFYRDRGVDTVFVGHPLSGLARPTVSREAYAQQNTLDVNKHWITLMPGSRVKEVQMNLPTILEVVEKLGATYEFLLPVAPTVETSFVHALIGNASINLVPTTLPALAHSRAGIIASGTATVEAALMDTPFVMVYRVSSLTYLLGRSRVKVPHFSMVNLIAGEKIVTELVQHDFNADNVLAQLNAIVPEGVSRDRMLRGLAGVRARLRGHALGDMSAAERAASAIFEVWERERVETGL